MKKQDKIIENFSTQLGRLFYNPNIRLGVNGTSVKNITIQVTEDCNLKCTYCYQHSKTPKKLDIETGKKFIDLILNNDEKSAAYIQSRQCQGVILDFIGGEPFLEIETISILTDYFINKMIELNHPWLFRYRINIGSNGLLYFSDQVQAYIKKHWPHLSLGITIDGNKDLHDKCRIDLFGCGSYDRAIAALHHYENTYKRYGMSKVTIAPENILYFKNSIIDFIEHEKYSYINANCVFEKGWTLEHAKILYNELKELANYLLNNNLQDDVFVSILDQEIGKRFSNDDHPTCGGSGDMIALDVSGDIYPCIRYTPSSIGNPKLKFKIGDVEHGFAYDQETQWRIHCLSCITKTKQNATTEFCSTCPIEMGCNNCAAYSYEIFGEVGHKATFICDMHKARCLAAGYYQNKAYQKTGKKSPLELNCPKEWAIPIIGESEYNMLQQLSNEVNIL